MLLYVPGQLEQQQLFVRRQFDSDCTWSVDCSIRMFLNELQLVIRSVWIHSLLGWRFHISPQQTAHMCSHGWAWKHGQPTAQSTFAKGNSRGFAPNTVLRRHVADEKSKYSVWKVIWQGWPGLEWRCFPNDQACSPRLASSALPRLHFSLFAHFFIWLLNLMIVSTIAAPGQSYLNVLGLFTSIIATEWILLFTLTMGSCCLACVLYAVQNKIMNWKDSRK